MRSTRKTARERALRALTSTLVLALLAALLLAGSAQAAPGKPTAKEPRGAVATTKPTFKWSKAPRAAKYELRVYKGKQLLLKKSGLKKTSWTPATALPAGVDLTWKVRARNAGGAGAWSRSLKFRTTDPPPSGLKIGDAYGGGVVAYILQSGDPGYVAGETHGLVAAAADQTGGDGIQWAREPYWYTDVPGAKGTALGTGAANTTAIIAQNGAGTTYAAGLARAYAGGGFNDWCLPSKDELNQLYLNRAAIGGFPTASDYWPFYYSSSQDAAHALNAWSQNFDVGFQFNRYKHPPHGVRAVRAF